MPTESVGPGCRATDRTPVPPPVDAAASRPLPSNMNCAGCGFGAPPDFAFCPKCGRPLRATCPSCGADHPPDFAFCPKCGSALGAAPTVPPPATPGQKAGPRAAPPAADRRPATILFADLCGFTTVSERLDPEIVRGIQQDLFEALSALIVGGGGFVEKFAGDAVLAVFGAPVAHEDDPERALRAALAMHAAVAALADRWRPRIGAELSLHIGINTGPVVAGNLTSSAGEDYVVTGDAVNTAARLQNAAGADETLVSESTWRLSQHAFAFEPLGDIAMKGKARPVAVYRLAGELEQRRSSRGLEALGLRSALVGRDEEMARLESAFDRMLRGHAQIVSLIGEAGIGKARLIDAFLDRLASGDRLAHASVRRATCSALGEQSYGVIAAFCRESYGISSADDLATSRRKVATGLELLGGSDDETIRAARIVGFILGLDDPDDPLRDVEPEQLKRQIFMALHSLVERRLQQGALLLVIEDLHHADAASVDALRSIVERFADRPVMLLTDFRPDFDAGALLTARATHTAIRLRRLSAGDCHAILDGFFGASREAVPARLRDTIIERADGHPLYLEEIVRGLVADGALVREDGGTWTVRDRTAPDIAVPHTIRALLLSRIDRLAPAVRDLLHDASILGVAFDHATLEELRGPGRSIADGLQALVDAELIAELSPGPGEMPDAWRRRYRFTHTLVHEVAYSNLLTARRAELHGRAGRVLEARRLRAGASDRLEDLVAIGHQFSLSAEPVRGARYLIDAGDRARAVHANDDAIRLYERGVDILDAARAEPELVSAARERLGDLLGTRGDRERALAMFAQLHTEACERGDVPRQARMHRKIGGLHWEAGDRSRADEHFRAGLALLESDSDPIELAHLHQEIGRLAFRGGDHEGAIDWARRSLRHADAIAGATNGAAEGEDVAREIAAVRSHAYNTLGIALARQGRLQDAVTHIEKSVEVAEAEGLLPAACRGYANLGVLYSTLSPRKAIETCKAGLASARRIGHLGLESQLQANLAVAYCALTDRCGEEGHSAAQEAADLDRQLGQVDHLAVPLIVLGQIHQCNGRWQPAYDYYSEALEIAERTGEPQLLFPCLDGLGTLLLEAGQPDRAEPFMHRAQTVCEQAGVEPDSLIILPFLS